MSMKISGIPDRTNEFGKRLVVHCLMLVIYMIGTSLPLFGVEGDSIDVGWWNAQTAITSILNGPNSQATFMSLGMAPYINASILVGMVTLSQNAEAKARISRRRVRRWTGILTFFISFFSALGQSRKMKLSISGLSTEAVRGIVIAEMLLGMAVLFWLVEINKKRGIGGITPIIFLNVFSSLVVTAKQEDIFQYRIMCIFCLFVIAITLFSEVHLVKIPLQRVSIHNIHADQNYLAFKLNPIGMIPVMFSTAVFIGVRFFVDFMARIFSENVHWQRIQDGFVMTKFLGAVVFVTIIVILAIGFSYVLLSPTDLTRQLMRSGDSIVGIAAGKKTRKYLRKRLFLLTLHSGAVEGLCIGISLHLVLLGRIPSTIAMLPMNIMLLTSFTLTIAQEMRSYYLYDAYRFFL